MDEFDWSILSVPTARAVVRGQLEFSWWELGQRLETVTQDEFLWEPGPGALSVRRRGETTAPRAFGVGEWVVEWPESGDHPGPRTVAWLVAHLTDVLSERYDWTFGDHQARRATLTYSGEVGTAVAELTRVVDLWRAGIAGMSDDDIFTVGFSQATEIDQQSPFAHLVAHINREIIHHGSEIFTLTDLYRVRGGAHV